MRLLRLALFGLIPILALAESVNLNISPQSADSALMAFSAQTKIEVLFSSSDLHKVRSSGVVGSYEPADALERLLRDTGFTARESGNRKYVVRPEKKATGSIKGKLLAPSGNPAPGLRVTIPDADQSVVTDAQGVFFFDSVPPGTHELIASGTEYQSQRIDNAQVDPDRLLSLDARTLQAANDPTRLAPFVVQEEASHSGPYDRDKNTPPPLTAIGNIDLLRTEDEALPYTVLSRPRIARSGAVNLNEFLQRELLDCDATTRPPEQNGLSASFAAGSNNLNLRGYGSDETVILVNGRRLPEILTSGISQTPPPPDVNFIPLSLVDRVEVLPISASALYSGNPVGGVINIVLRPDIDATEMSVTYTNAMGGFDAPQSSASFQHGQTLLKGKLRLRLAATFTKTVPPTEAELGYIRANPQSNAGQEDRLYRATPNVRSADGSPLFGPGSSSATSVAPGADGSGGMAAFEGRQGVRNWDLFATPGGMANTPNSINYSYGRRQRGFSCFASATYDAFPWLQLGLDTIFSSTVVNRGYNVFTGDLTLRGDSPLNPFRRDVGISLNEIAPLLGDKYSEAHLDFFSSVFGLLAKLPGDWRASLDTQYGHNLTRYRGVSGVDSESWQKLVDEGAYNPLRDTQVYAPPPEFYDRALIYYGRRGSFVTLGDYETLDSAFRVTNRSLPLPTGHGAASFGGDYRLNHLASFSDERRFGDGTLVDTPSRWRGRTLQRISAFGELQAPLLPPRWLPPWLRKIEADVAARYVASDSSQERNTAPTCGLKMDFLGGFSLRGSIATSNRMPTPYMSRKVSAPDGTGGGDVIYASIFDPLRDQSYIVTSQDAINPNLRTESAVSRSAGVIFQRGQTHRFRAALDFVDTQKSGELFYLGSDAIVKLETQFPQRVVRAPLAVGDSHSAGYVTSVLTGNFNLSWRHSQNWTGSLDYEWTECLGGTLELAGRFIYFQRYDMQLLPTSPMIDELRQPDGAASGLLRFRSNLRAGWYSRLFGFGLEGHYFHSRILPAMDWANQGSDHIDPFWQFDTYVEGDLGRWFLKKHSRFSLRGQLRINNVFGAPPSKYANDPSGAGVQPYGDWRGRTYFMSVTAAF
ncbi:MAG: TonB-dependent receptor plug domain-containing protein [Opitutaceae bacterium]|jgi:outer membrane receptor protein involved in Fe transport